MATSNIKKIIECRPAKWPTYYDDANVKDYCEYFIKGTNVKLGFRVMNIDENCVDFCCIVSESQDDQIYFEEEAELFDHFEYILMNKEFGWQYFY